MIQDVTRLGGVKVDYGYDNIGQLTSAKGKEADGTTPRLNEQLGYGYDASHNLAVRTNATLIQTFTSDSRNQLASVVRNGTLTSAGSVVGAVATLGVNGKQAAIYGDKTFATTEGITLANGTNVFVTTGSNAAGALVISTLEKAVLPVTVNCTYDLNGNITSDGLKGFEYDDANQLTRITVTNAWKSEFSYDGLGRRRITKDYTWTGSAWSKTNEVRYVYDGMAVLQERDGNNAELVTYTRGLDLSGSMQGAGGIGGLLARTEHSATASLLASSSYYHSDAGGNITAMTDSSGNVVAKYLYDPFGNLLAKSGAMADVNRYRFSSKEVHLNSGSYYYGFRFYEPNLQRWLNEDPIREAGGMNLFGFVGNGPMNEVDPLGLSGWMDMRALPNYKGPCTLTPSVPPITLDELANYGAGLGDGLSLNLTKLGRHVTGIDNVDTGSMAYTSGSLTSLAVGVGRLAYAGLAKGGSICAKTPEAASAFRESLKNFFRLGGGKNWRPPNLTGKTGEALRASAGRTHPGINAYGAGIAGASGANAIDGDDNPEDE